MAVAVEEYVAKLAADYGYLPLARGAEVAAYLDGPPCGVECIKRRAVDVLTAEEDAADRQLVYTLAQDKALAVDASAYALAHSDVRALRSTRLDGYEFLRREREDPGRWGRRAAKAYAKLLFLNFAFSPRARGRRRVLAATVQSRLLLAFMPLEPLRITALPKDAAEAAVDFSFELRRRAVEAYLRVGLRSPAEAVPYLREHVEAVAGRLFDEIPAPRDFLMAVVADHLYDEAVYAYHYLRHYGLISGSAASAYPHGANL
jgi:hypothetical protein